MKTNIVFLPCCLIAAAFHWCFAEAADAFAGNGIDSGYVRSLALPGKAVLVMEYYDGDKRVALRKGYASTSPFHAASGVDISLDAQTSLRLYGLQPCQGEIVNRSENFTGSCEDFARGQLEILVRTARVLLCRAFLSDENAIRKDVTCFGYYNFPGSLDSVDNIEEQMLSLGALRLSRKPDGTLLRPDLAASETIGRRGFGMWADPRTKP
jgi:hypothetical protein